MCFGHHLDHFGEPIGRLLATFYDHFSNVNAKKDFLIFDTPLTRFACFYGSGWLEIRPKIT